MKTVYLKHAFAAILIFLTGYVRAQTVTISPSNSTFGTGTIGATSAYMKYSGDINLLNGTYNNYGNGWMRFDLSVIPAGATITGASVFYYASYAPPSGGATSIKGYATTPGSASDPAVATGSTLFSLCNATSGAWTTQTGLGNHTAALGATAISYIQASYATSPLLALSFSSSAASIIQATTISGYNTANTAQRPYLTITYTTGGTTVPPPTIVSTTSPVCVGGTISITASSTAASPVFNWTGPGYTGSGPTINIPNATAANAGTYSVTVTSGGNTSTATTTSVLVNPAVNPAVSIVANPTGPICSNTPVTFTATPTNGGAAPAYQWKKNGVNVGTNSSTYTDNGLTNGNTISCVLTSNAVCATPASVTSNTVTMAVNSSVAASVSIAANTGTSICSGTPVTYTATPTNGGTAPAYQWKKNNINVGTNSSVYTDNAIANGDVVACLLTSNAACASPLIVTSNTLTMTVGTSLSPGVSIVANPGNSICSGASVTFTATPTNGGATPVYQWKKNNANVGTNSPTYTDNSLASSDVVNCVLTSSSTCASTTTATSNSMTITVNATVTPGITITASPSATVCMGTAVTFNASALNGGTAPAYQWKKNNVNVGTNNAVFSSNTLASGEIITCVLTSNAACASATSATSNGLNMVINPLPNKPTITKLGNVLTSSTPASNQWIRNNVDITGATGQTYTTLTDGWYQVRSTNVNGCANKSDSVFHAVNTGVGSASFSAVINVYPTPFNDLVHIDFKTSIWMNKDYQLRVTNCFGQTVYSSVIEHQKSEIHLGQLASGIYILSLSNGVERMTMNMLKK